MGMKIVQGRDFSPDYGTDLEHGVLINRALAGRMKWDDPVGKRLNSSWGNKDLVVTGVVENFHFRSFREVIEPTVISLSQKDNLYNMGIRLKSYDLNKSINYIKSSWEKINPGYPFEYQFLDQKIRDNYHKDQKQAHILLLFSFLAIAITCLGLTATSSIYAKQRTKEIGVRKINGASVIDILALLNRDFILWVVFAFITSIPVAYIAIHNWLENFAYRIELSWFVYILGGLMALIIAIVTITLQSWSTSTRNPIEALRYE
jgi:putative ABC transport system permease protein